MGISQQQALDCFASDDLIGIGMEADSVRRSLHPDGIVTYAVDRAFYLTRDHASLLDEIESAVAEGVATIRIDSPSEPMGLDDLEALLTVVRGQFSSLKIQALSAAHVAAIAAEADISEADALMRLHAAGLDALEGSTQKLSPERWLELHAAAHRAGLRSRASLEFGGTIGAAEFVSRLMALYALQSETAGFTALSLHGFQPDSDRAEFEKPTAVEYLRTLAVARMVLDNVENIESSGIDEGLKVMQMALRFGANDGGTISGVAGASFTEADLRRVIRDAGFVPVERDTLYQTMFLNN